MTDSAVEILPAGRIRLVETALPALSGPHRSAMDRAWAEAVGANPALFDGPVAVLTRLDRDGAGGLVLSWARARYRYRALRHVPGAPALASLFVSVLQPADDGRLMVGRMAPSTAAPGRWQLPGGTIEPPDADGELDLAALRAHAARELAEETGSDTPADALTPWLTTRGGRGSVGVTFTAPPRPARELYDRYAELVRTETARGADPEFDRIELIGAPSDLDALDGPHVDYLRPVVRRSTGG
ncbi:NUDIX domain-containing protein [Streptomyces sp. FXJ1.172]|uniref:NUDIX domain-containing protein n=1 Tax=Streptomyces sp. FXJ1.172 TaxID=710705 RepID=UPI0007CF57A4|nr:NUDIX domain-containing protein [Streptomyces sp. FXJ1.172]WEO99041.1 NUDIX domain-containing protein [Streptomyces sp. FXJ1.172]